MNHICHSRAVAFPELSKLSEVFDSFELRRPTDKCSVRPFAGLRVQMGGSISGKNFRCFAAVPRPAIISHVSKTMLVIDNDTIYFEIVERDDDTALIVAKYNAIIGGRWLALIPGSEIPDWR